MLSPDAVTLVAEAEGVSINTRSEFASAATATHGVVVTEPTIA